MKRIITICLIVLASSFTMTAQTGTGVIAQINSPYTFTPTTVDSTTTISVQFNNTFSIPTSVSFSGLQAPFSTSLSSLNIPGSDNVMVDINFNPTLLGNHTDTLEFTNSLLPGASLLVLHGEGVQVSIATSTDTVDFGSLPLGGSISETFKS